MTVGRLVLIAIIALVIMFGFLFTVQFSQKQLEVQKINDGLATATAEAYVISEKNEDIKSKLTFANTIASKALELDSTQRIAHAIVAAHIVKTIDADDKFDKSPPTRRAILQVLNDQPADISEPSQIHLDDQAALPMDTLSSEHKWLLTFQEMNAPFLVNLRSDDPNNLLRIDVGAEPISQATFSPHDKWLVLITKSNTPKLVKLDEVSDGYKAITLENHALGIVDHAFSQNDNWFVTGSHDFNVRLWQLEGLNQENATAKMTKISQRDESKYPGHTRSVMAVSFDPHSHWLGSGDLSGQIFLWNLDTPDPALQPIRLKLDANLFVADILFADNEDQEWLIAIGRNIDTNKEADYAYFWNMDIEHLISQVCRLHKPTPEQIAEIVPDVYPFELPVCP